MGDLNQAEQPDLQRWLESVGARLAEARQKRGETRERLARRLRLPADLLAGIEAGRGDRAGLAATCLIADALRIPVADLLAGPGTSRLDRDPGSFGEPDDLGDDGGGPE